MMAPRQFVFALPNTNLLFQKQIHNMRCCTPLQFVFAFSNTNLLFQKQIHTTATTTTCVRVLRFVCTWWCIVPTASLGVSLWPHTPRTTYRKLPHAARPTQGCGSLPVVRGVVWCLACGSSLRHHNAYRHIIQTNNTTHQCISQ